MSINGSRLCFFFRHAVASLRSGHGCSHTPLLLPRSDGFGWRSGGRQRRARLVQGQPFSDRCAESGKGTLQRAIRVDRWRWPRRYLIHCRCFSRNFPRRRFRVSEHVGVGSANHLPAARPLAEQVALDHQDPGDPVLPGQQRWPIPAPSVPRRRCCGGSRPWRRWSRMPGGRRRCGCCGSPIAAPPGRPGRSE